MSNKKSTLKLVSPTTAEGVQPPRKLGQAGKDLWQSVISEYAIEDSGGLQMLALACSALDRAESCKAQIDAEGETIRTKVGLKDHPLLRHEAVSRAFVVKTLRTLGLDVEPLRSSVGRPPGLA